MSQPRERVGGQPIHIRSARKEGVWERKEQKNAGRRLTLQPSQLVTP